MKSKFDDRDKLDRMRLDPDNYKWGIFYFNSQDPRAILPKRNPYWGLTVNFANPYSYLILIITLTLILMFNTYM